MAEQKETLDEDEEDSQSNYKRSIGTPLLVNTSKILLSNDGRDLEDGEWFTVDLDDPPEKRWLEVLASRKDQLSYVASQLWGSFDDVDTMVGHHQFLLPFFFFFFF